MNASYESVRVLLFDKYILAQLGPGSDFVFLGTEDMPYLILPKDARVITLLPPRHLAPI